MNNRGFAIAASTLLLAGSVMAQSEVPMPPPIREPLPPKISNPSEQIQPEVRIRREQDRTVEEYVSGGQVYMVKIQPAVGPAYFLIDSTGDGLLDLQYDRFEPVKPVYWKIFEW